MLLTNGSFTSWVKTTIVQASSDCCVKILHQTDAGVFSELSVCRYTRCSNMTDCSECAACPAKAFRRWGLRGSPPPSCSRLGDLAVVAGAVLRRALRRPDGLGAFQAVPFAAAAVG